MRSPRNGGNRARAGHIINLEQPEDSEQIAARQAVVVAEFPLNTHQCFRAEIIERDGKPIVSIARWKNTPVGARRTGQSMEFGAHRIGAVAGLLNEVQRVLDALVSKEARHESHL